MAGLAISLFGPFQAAPADGVPLATLNASKVRALLAYLAVEADRPQSRSRLAGLFWPERSDPVALNNLRCALSDLRQAVAPVGAAEGPLLVKRNSIQLDLAGCWVDVHAFEAELAAASDPPFAISHMPSAIRHLQAAVALYRGRFLEDLSLGDCPEFEEWALLQCEQYERQALEALFDLAALYQSSGAYEKALACARRQVELSPWREEAHQQAMQALVALGRRSEALAQYEECRRLLARELRAAPGSPIATLYEAIRSGHAGLPLPRPPLTAGNETEPHHRAHREHRGREETPVSSVVNAGPGEAADVLPFVAREPELARLERALQAALAGEGQALFVSGEAGMGKSALLAAFAEQAMRRHGGLVVAGGSANTYSGLGDPYLPFRELLQLLSGDVEARRAGGALTPEQARRLWALLPATVQALLDAGPDLVGSFVPGAALALRAEAFVPAGAGQERLAELCQHKPSTAAGLEQAGLFDQFSRVLQALAAQRPLLVLLDDLQWADAGTIALLFHLARRLAGSRILLLGAYRSDEVALGRSGERHPLEPVVHELGRQYGDILVDLAQAEGRRLVEALVDAEPNRLGEAFRETLFRHTAGNALFAVELLRSLKEQGGLAQDGAGCWVEGSALDWGRCPARVEAVIAERIGRLPAGVQMLLEAAAVQGTELTVEVIARVCSMDEEQVLRHLHHLSGPHGLVVAQRFERVAGRKVSRYRFRHELFQRYLDSRLAAAMRVRLHEAVGRAIDDLYGAQKQEHSAELAHHFEAAGLTERAVAYWLQAGRHAERLSAHEDAIALFRHGLALLERLPASPERDRQELELQLALGIPLLFCRGWGTSERAQAFERAVTLAQRLDAGTELALALLQQSEVLRGQGRQRQALAQAETLLQVARGLADPLYLMPAHWNMGACLFLVGEFTAARGHLEQAIATYDRSRHGPLLNIVGLDVQPHTLSWLCEVLWILGYPEQAEARAREVLELTRSLDQPADRALALLTAGCMLNQMQREPGRALAYAEELAALVRSSELRVFEPWVAWLQGWKCFRAGQTEVGVRQMREGVAAWQGRRTPPGAPHQLTVLIDALLQAGLTEEGLHAADAALAACEGGDAHPAEAELWRLKGELLATCRGGSGTAPADAEACFRRAIDIARRQEARSWELRATISLARLLDRHGRRDEAQQMLAGIYGWFTEGFDTADLREAKALLDALHSARN